MEKGKSRPLRQRGRSFSESFLWGRGSRNLEALSGGKVMPSASNDALSLRPDKGKRKACRLPAEWRVELRSSETTIAVVWVRACGGLDLVVTGEMGTWVHARYVLQV